MRFLWSLCVIVLLASLGRCGDVQPDDRIHVAFLSVPLMGHMAPMIGIAEELLRRGHRVTFPMTSVCERERACEASLALTNVNVVIVIVTSATTGCSVTIRTCTASTSRSIYRRYARLEHSSAERMLRESLARAGERRRHHGLLPAVGAAVVARVGGVAAVSQHHTRRAGDRLLDGAWVRSGREVQHLGGGQQLWTRARQSARDRRRLRAARADAQSPTHGSARSLVEPPVPSRVALPRLVPGAKLQHGMQLSRMPHDESEARSFSTSTTRVFVCSSERRMVCSP